jgi:hypothetical protein
MGRHAIASACAAIAAIVLAGGATLAVSVRPGTAPPARSVLDADDTDRWPKTLDDFLAGNYLRRADIVLTRREYDPTSFLIRWATKSPFSHAALVFTTPDQEPGIGNTFVIEAGTGGVDLTNLRDYATDEASFVAIKRLRQTWFDEEKQSRVRGLLLDNIKSEYNYWAIVRIVRNIWFGLERSMRGKDKAVQQFDKREWKRPNEFICSGLVQFGFVEAVAEYVLQRKLPPWALNEVVFSETAAARLISKEEWERADPSLIDLNIPEARKVLANDLEAITPDDLAQSDRLEWLYFIRNGKVHKVGSYSEVRTLAR